MSLGHHLGAEQNIALSPVHLPEERIVRLPAFDGIAVHSCYSRSGKQEPQFFFDLLRAGADQLQVDAGAQRTFVGRLREIAAVVALDFMFALMIRKGYAAPRTFDGRAAIAADKDGRKPAPVQKQKGLLVPVKPLRNSFY